MFKWLKDRIETRNKAYKDETMEMAIWINENIGRMHIEQNWESPGNWRWCAYVGQKYDNCYTSNHHTDAGAVRSLYRTCKSQRKRSEKVKQVQRLYS